MVTNVHTFIHPLGYVEATNQSLLIPSLYEKQLAARLNRGVPPDAPARLQAQLADGIISLSWLDVASKENAYIVELSTDGGNSFAEIAELEADQSTFLHTELPSITGELIYRVYAIANNCPSPYSNEAKVNIVTSISTVPIPNLYLFPNPFSDTIQIQTTTQLDRINVFDSKGHMVLETNAVQQLSTSHWGKGMYFLKIVDKEGRMSLKKMLKQ